MPWFLIKGSYSSTPLPVLVGLKIALLLVFTSFLQSALHEGKVEEAQCFFFSLGMKQVKGQALPAT